MFASCLGDHVPESGLSGAGDKFFYSVTSSAKSKACIKLVNAASTPQPVSLTLTGLGNGTRTARVQTLRANTTWATNTITAPVRIVPVPSKVKVEGEKLQHTVPAYSIQLLEIDLK